MSLCVFCFAWHIEVRLPSRLPALRKAVATAFGPVIVFLVSRTLGTPDHSHSIFMFCLFGVGSGLGGNLGMGWDITVHLHLQSVMIQDGVGVGWDLMFPPSLVLDVDAPWMVWGWPRV